MPNTNGHAEAAHKSKVLEVIAAVSESAAANPLYRDDPAALAASIEAAPASWWTAVAEVVTRRREANGDTRTCHAPSAETVAEVVAHFRARLTPLERASMAMAEGGASGSSCDPDESMEFLTASDRHLFREIQERHALNSLDSAKWDAR